MSHYDPEHKALYHALIDQGLERWVAVLPEQLKTGLDPKRFGDLPGWRSAVEKLPELPEDRQVFLNGNTVRVTASLSSGEIAKATNLLRHLMPWRKGPFSLAGIDIETEWRSDLKWQRIEPHISPLQGRRVLDVGGGSGYHGWRMTGAGASFVMIIDPSPRFYFQFHAVRHFIGEERAKTTHYLPVGIEDVPARLAAFDTVFSMGVLYHRRDPLEHLDQLRETLRVGGELVLETLVVEGDEQTVFMPGERYACMPNVYFLPSSMALKHWLERCGFTNIRIVNEETTQLEEQRRTEWMTFQSLQDFLNPDDHSLTVEGYPAPRRAVLIAERAR